jgi:hypothetical protein
MFKNYKIVSFKLQMLFKSKQKHKKKQKIQAKMTKDSKMRSKLKTILIPSLINSTKC